MQTVVVFAAVMAVASAGFAPLGFGPTVAVAGGPVSSQYHAQDELGQYSYGYAGGPSAKSESKTADGITRGAYSYVDANGILQQVQYVSDPVNGFRVSATNLPVAPAGVAQAAPLALAAAPAPVHFAAAAPVHFAQLPIPVDDTPEVKAAKAEHFRAYAEAAARAALP
jgi:hypothetical protein